MLLVLRNSWALLLGIMLLMVGNGLQGTLLGVRGEIEGFSTFEMSVVMSAYFAGFLIGSRMGSEMIRRVGHIRTFAALGSVISAVLILYPVLTDPIAWTVLRLIIGACFAAVYVTAESWLNNAATNETRGQTLSVYLVVQMVGIVAAQMLLNLGDPSDYFLFVVLSVLVSLSFAPILLSVTPTPAFETAKPMSLMEVLKISPLGVIGTFLMGGVYSAMFGMAAVFATQAGLPLAQLSIFVSAFYVGGLVLQFPIGWISDRMDRRLLIMILAAICGAAGLLGALSSGIFSILVISAFFIGGMANPLYALLIAYVNDFLEAEQMPAAGGRLLFVNGVGAIFGPIVVGGMMQAIGPLGYFYFIGGLVTVLALYAAYRMTVRPAPTVEDTGSYAPVLPSASPVVVGLAQEVFADAASDDGDDAQGTLPPAA